MPDNGGFATAAYVVAAVIYVTYAITIRVRMHTLRKRAQAMSGGNDNAR
jgi:hypothetical protein